MGYSQYGLFSMRGILKGILTIRVILDEEYSQIRDILKEGYSQ